MTLSYLDVELVFIGGRVHLASDELRQRLPESARAGLDSIVIEGTRRWIRAPVERLFQKTEPHLPDGIFLGGKRVTHDIRD